MQRKSNVRRRKSAPNAVGNDLAGFVEALKMIDVEIWFDIRETAFMVRFGTDAPVESDDLAMAFVRQTLSERVALRTDKGPMPYSLSKERFYHLRDALGFTDQRDSFLDYLDSLPLPELHGIDSYDTCVDHLLSDVLDALNDNYHRHISRMIFLGSVARTYEPGYKMDEVPVIKGPQGVGKDSYLASLMPKPNYHTDSFSFAMPHKSKVEVTRGRVVVVASEMGGVTTTKDLEHLKQYVTATHDSVRLAYRRDVSNLPRRFTFACTTNLDKPLPDDATGNRRWCVAEVRQSQVGAVEPYLDKRRDELWATAVALWRKGVRPNLPREMKTWQNEMNEDYRRSDEAMATAYDDALKNDMLKLKPQTLTDVAIALAVTESREEFAQGGNSRLQHRLRNELVLRGWVSRSGRKKRTGPKERLWFPDNVEKEGNSDG